jgi:hypothetical protein
VIQLDGLHKGIDGRSSLALGDVTTPTFFEEPTEGGMVTFQHAKRLQGARDSVQEALGNRGEEQSIPLIGMLCQHGPGGLEQLAKTLLAQQRSQLIRTSK